MSTGVAASSAPGGPDLEATRAALGRLVERELAVVAQREPTVRAWVCRHDAERLRQGVAEAPAGPLLGFTVGVKDIIDTADLPTERGSAIYRARLATADAAVVALARAAGGLVTGKTVTTEFAYLRPGPTTNPHDPARTPGGSSSGSAAAVAAGMVRVAFGTQTGGSVIRPASFCGVVGCKPTFHLVPTTGVHPLAGSFDTVGWYGRTLDDVEQVLSVLAPPAAPAPVPEVPRIGLYRTHEVAEADPTTVAALERVAAELAAAGAEVVEVEPFPPFAGLVRAHGTIMAAEAARCLAWERLHHHGELSAPLQQLVAAGLEVTADAYAGAQQQAVAGRATLAESFGPERFDALLTFAAPGEAPPGTASTGDSVFNRVWTMLGAPCVSLPAASGPNGMPVGVQLVGPRWGDRALLAVARAVATMLDLPI